MGKIKKHRLTRYKVNKRGRLQASRKGYICKAEDVERLEELVMQLRSTRRDLSDSLLVEKTATESALAINKEIESNRKECVSVLEEAMAFLEHCEAGDNQLSERIKRSITPVSYWRRLWCALIGRN